VVTVRLARSHRHLHAHPKPCTLTPSLARGFAHPQGMGLGHPWACIGSWGVVDGLELGFVWSPRALHAHPQPCTLTPSLARSPLASHEALHGHMSLVWSLLDSYRVILGLARGFMWSPRALPCTLTLGLTRGFAHPQRSGVVTPGLVSGLGGSSMALSWASCGHHEPCTLTPSLAHSSLASHACGGWGWSPLDSSGLGGSSLALNGASRGHTTRCTLTPALAHSPRPCTLAPRPSWAPRTPRSPTWTASTTTAWPPASASAPWTTCRGARRPWPPSPSSSPSTGGVPPPLFWGSPLSPEVPFTPRSRVSPRFLPPQL